MFAFSPDQWQAVRLSVFVAAVATAACLPPGIAVAWLLARRDFWGKTLLETLINLPLVLPPVVTGYLLLVTFGRQGWIGRWLDRLLGLQIVFTWKGAALASAVMAFPFLVRSIRLAFAQIDVRLEQAARTLGAGPLDAFFTVSLPLAREGVIAGCALGFARSLGEFGATIMISGSIPGETRTIPLEIYSLVESPGGADQAQGLILAAVLIAAGAMAAAEVLERRGRARLTAGG